MKDVGDFNQPTLENGKHTKLNWVKKAAADLDIGSLTARINQDMKMYLQFPTRNYSLCQTLEHMLRIQWIAKHTT